MQIMLEFYHPSAVKPKVMGLTASPVVSGNITQKSNLKDDLKALCFYLDCDFAPVDRENVASVANKPVFKVKEFGINKEISFDWVSKNYVMFPACEETRTVISEISHNGKYIHDLLGKRGFGLYITDLIDKVDNDGIKFELERL